MSIEECGICKQEGTAWFHIQRHICHDCYHNAIHPYPEWKSVKSSLPNDNDIVLATNRHEMAVCKFDSPWGNAYLFMINDTSLQLKDVTHWSPLPESPYE